MKRITRDVFGASFLAIIALSAMDATADISKQHVGIAAQVGGEAVSSVDVEDRIHFIIATAHISTAPDVISRVRQQVMRSLVDEKLQIQEAQKNDIVVDDKDINQTVDSIEQQRGMPSGTIFKMLAANNVPKETFLQQIRAQLSWNRLLVKKIRPTIHVSDTEINLISSRAVPLNTQAAANPQEYQIAVTLLPVDKPSREKEVKSLGEKLVREVRGGASFEELSRQFSSSAASAGGKVEAFWVTLNQVDPRIAQVLQGAKAGTIIDPVQTPEGFTIIKVYKTRDIPGKKPAKPAADNVGPGSEVDEKAARHEQLYQMVVQQKMELEAQKYLRNLRRETFIDVR